MERKSGFELKSLDEKGQFVARIARLNSIDKDQDVAQPGAFGNQQVAPVVIGHRWDMIPLGKVGITEEGDEVLARGRLNLGMGAGKALYEALKFDAANPPKTSQFSYAFSLEDFEHGIFEGQRVRFLKKLKVHEISAVLVGAGDTALVAVKEDLTARTAEVVAEYHRLRERGAQLEAQLAAQEFERICERAQEQHAYRFVKFWSCDEPYRTALHAAKRAARELGIKMPEIKIFTSCGPEVADFTMSVKSVGYARAGGWEIGVAADIMDERDIAWIAAHEVKHLAGGGESEADEFAEAFIAKAFGTVSRSPGSWSWDVTIAHARALRQLGVM